MNDAQFRKKERLSHKNEAVSLFYGLSLLLFRRICHLKHEGASAHDLFVGDEIPVVGCPVPLNFIDIYVLYGEVQRLHGKSFSFTHRDGYLWQLWCAEDQLAADRVDRVETHGGEHVPGGHLSAIVVTDQSVGFVLIEVGGDLPYQLLRLFGTVEPVVDVGH